MSNLIRCRRVLQLAFVVVSLLTVLVAGKAQAVSVGLTLVPPTPGTLFPGSSVFVAVSMSGLTAGSDPSVTAFDLDIAFDPSQLSFVSASFLPVAGFGLSSCPPVPFDPLCEAIISTSTSSGNVTLAASSLLAPTVIDATQPASAAIALLQFLAISDGSSSLSFTGLDVAGTGPGSVEGTLVATGSTLGVLVMVPEPGTASLLSIGLLAMGWTRRRRRSG